jgi:L-aminopeptidase/D-esterase-like protein
VIPGGTLTSVPGVAVGHHTDLAALTGVTVMTFPEPNVAAVDVRGAAPGTRETALLAPGMKVETIQALVFAGGSAFGLAAADGVVRELAAAGRGHPTPAGPVPIVPAAIIFDLVVGDGSVRPSAADGAAAYRAASEAPVAQGNVGAGTGAAVAKWRGPGAFRKAGVGSAAIRSGGAILGALVVLNAVGDVFTLEGEALTGGPHSTEGFGLPASPLENTTLVALATDAALSRTDLLRTAVRAHDALGACLRPAHTRYDGDAVFAVSCGGIVADLDGLGEAAFTVTGRALEAALRNAAPIGAIPGVGS